MRGTMITEKQLQTSSKYVPDWTFNMQERVTYVACCTEMDSVAKDLHCLHAWLLQQIERKTLWNDDS
jgi:hypothetical protein